MRLKPLHTIWLTLFTTLILLVSSVVNSAPLMSLKMMSSSNMMSDRMAEMGSEQDHCGSLSMNTEMTQSNSAEPVGMSMNCVDDSGIAHNCCAASCSFVFVPLPTPASHHSPLVYRASISTETTAPLIQVTHDLYRPPIV